jgi:nucleoside phosphorylase
MKFLVVAAFEPELTRFRELASRGSKLAAELVVEAVGVGVVEAAIGVTRCVAAHRPTHALMLGTCGAFAAAAGPAADRAHPAVGDVVTGARARLLDAAVLEERAAAPGPMPLAEALDAALHDALVAAGAKSVQIANTIAVTIDDALAARAAASLASLASGEAGEAGEPARPALPAVEHLEAFAFARACARAGVAAGVALGVANVVGADGREAWRNNHVEASARAAAVAWTALVRTSTRARSPARG